MKRKLIAILLAAALLCALLPQTILFASAEGETSGTCGDNLQWSFDKATGTLTITGSGAMTDWDNPYVVSWNSYKDSIQSVVISDGVTSIGSYAFDECNAMKSIILPDSVTSIGTSSFSNCWALTGISIPNGVTSIGNEAFIHCEKITSITIPGSVTSIGERAFSLCYRLTSITISDGVTSIGDNVFYDCSSLTSISIPASVTSIGDLAFYSCDDLTSITVSGGNLVYDSRNNCNAIIETATNTLIAGCKNTKIPGSVTSIGDWAFCGCEKLTNLTIPDSVTSIGDWAFSGCSNLTSVTIPDGLTSIGNFLFSSCGRLTNITIPDRVTSIGESAFDGCWGLTSITIPDSVTSIGASAFANCTGLTSISVSAGNVVYDSRNNCNAIIETATNTLIVGCKNTKIPDSVTAIGNLAYDTHWELTSITIPDSVTSIGSGAFHFCANIIAIFYGGTQDEWTKIEIAEENDYLNGANIHYEVTDVAAHCTLISSVKPTCLMTGTNTYSCSCGYIWTETTDALGHLCLGDTCIRCGMYINEPTDPIEPVDPCEGYTDLPAGSWYYNAAGFALSHGIMGSTKTDVKTFEPTTACTRSMIATMLYSLEGKPAVTFEAKFPDVREGQWFTAPVMWAYQNGVVTGYGNGNFGPNDKVTREQMAVILKAYTEKVKGFDTSKITDLSKFADANKVTWSKPFITWAVAEGLISGKAVGDKLNLDPQGNATRAEVAAIMMSFISKVLGE